MANYNNTRTDRRPGGFNRKPERPADFDDNTPLDLPADYVDEAERVIQKLGQPDRYNPSKLRFSITTSKLRNILTLVSDIYNIESRRTEETLLPESYAKLQMLRIRILYECGRYEKEVRPFVKESKLLRYIKGIEKNRQKMIDFSHYMEALVAFHRYFGGREN